jgi:hypothetical protein
VGGSLSPSPLAISISTAAFGDMLGVTHSVERAVPAHLLVTYSCGSQASGDTLVGQPSDDGPTQPFSECTRPLGPAARASRVGVLQAL